MHRYVFVIILTLSVVFMASCGKSTSSGVVVGTEEETTSLSITGTLSQANLATSLLKANTDTNVVTDVLAVSPQTGNRSCVSVEVGTDGTFSIPISSGNIWSLFFYNRYRSGFSMFSGWFRGATFDALAPNISTGAIDLETVSVDATAKVASSSKSESSILSDLDLTSDMASTLDNIDDVSGRYSNPDVDDDGLADCDQSDRNIMLDFHIRFYLPVDGTNATVSDIIDNFLSTETTTTSYSSTGVYVSYLNSFSSATSGTVNFTNSAVKVENGTTYSAGTEIDDNASDNSFGNYNSFGVNLSSDSELPSGEMVFTFGGKTVTFSNVETPSLADINAPSGRLFIFIKFDKDDPSCTSDCTLSGFGYKWLKKTSTGWTIPTLAEIGMIVADNTPNLGIRINNDQNKMITLLIPDDSLSGTIPWTASNFTLAGATSSEFENLVVTQICHIGLSYDDKMGMRYFHNISDAPGTCL